MVFPVLPRSQVAERDRWEESSGRSDELAWQARWFSGELGRQFTSTDGRSVEIVQFGHWNRGAGPDFTEAAVRIDGTLMTGDIEMDLEATGWESHGHSTNPSFGGVVLHVHLHRPADGTWFTRTADHRQVTQVELDPSLADGRPPWWGRLPEARLGRCAAPLRDFSTERLNTLLSSAAQYRLQRKAERWGALARSHSTSQALFCGCAEALGYRHNKLPMFSLAQRLPVDTVLSRHPAPIIEALCFGIAGYLEAEHFDRSKAETRGYLKDLWDHWWKFRIVHELTEGRRPPWNPGAGRPANHPQRRLAALALLAGQWRGFMNPLMTQTSLDKGWWREFQRQCAGLEHPFWSYHYTLRSTPTRKSMALLGSDRILDLLGNVLFPHLIQEGATTWETYTDLPGTTESGSLRRALLRLFGPDLAANKIRSTTGKYYQQQGLLQVFQDFCLRDHSECEECPFPEQLRQWS
ncbi:MAG: DUF2851 family protein [Verrucomicrobiales bacterium]